MAWCGFLVETLLSYCILLPHRQEERGYPVRLNRYKKQCDLFICISLYYQNKLVNYALSLFYSSENGDLKKLTYLSKGNQLIRARIRIQIHSAVF